MINRWKRCKNEIGRRQTEIKEAFDRLGRFKKNLDKHVSFLDKTEDEFNQIANTEAATSEAIQRKIDSIEEIKKDVDAKQQDFETVSIWYKIGHFWYKNCYFDIKLAIFGTYQIIFEMKMAVFDAKIDHFCTESTIFQV